jgi:tetratricopeptide (TPR) repeat protein
MTWVDPTFVPGYLVGAQMILFDNRNNLPQALAFLEEGARQNPKSIALFTELGRYHLVYTQRYDLSEHYLQKALENGADWTPTNPFEREGLLYAYRWLALKAYKQGELGKMRTWAWRGLQRFPEDGVLKMLMEKRDTLSSPQQAFPPQGAAHHGNAQ